MTKVSITAVIHFFAVITSRVGIPESGARIVVCRGCSLQGMSYDSEENEKSIRPAWTCFRFGPFKWEFPGHESGLREKHSELCDSAPFEKCNSPESESVGIPVWVKEMIEKVSVLSTF